MTATELLSHLHGVAKTSSGWSARCPSHEDSKASLSITEGTDGRILVHCHAGCNAASICSALSITVKDLFQVERNGHAATKSKIVCCYDYTDEQGNLLFQVVRFDPKNFKQRKPDPSALGGWSWSTKGVRKVLYRLPEVIAAVKRGLPILLCEGEKDVAALVERGFCATTNPGGAGKWLPEYSETLRGANVYLIPDNDESGGKHSKLVSEKLREVVKLRIVELPGELNGKKVKDAFDFFSTGGTSEKLIELIDAAGNADTGGAKSLFALESRRDSDPDELIRDRYLCRGGGLLLVAPTGVGKSVLAMQMMISFAVGRECFGIRPARPLSALLIQAENDEGDLAEMRDGIIHGLQLTPTELEAVKSRVMVFTEDAKTGPEVVNLADKLLATHTPDTLYLDPALSYLGGESNSQKDVGGFLRNLLNPVIHRHRCGSILVHHSNKPATGREKDEWKAGDFAYLGAGSAEWANWARAVLALRSIGSHSVYELRAGKRGARLGWKDDAGGHSFARFIGHSNEPGFIYWRDAAEGELEQGGRPKEYSEHDLLSLLPAEGLTSGEWADEAKGECGIKERRFFQLVKTLQADGRILKSKITKKWQPITKKQAQLQ